MEKIKQLLARMKTFMRALLKLRPSHVVVAFNMMIADCHKFYIPWCGAFTLYELWAMKHFSMFHLPFFLLHGAVFITSLKYYLKHKK